MRETPLPLLRDLPPLVAVVRCYECYELVLLEEACRGADEARLCLPRLALEGTPLIGFDERASSPHAL